MDEEDEDEDQDQDHGEHYQGRTIHSYLSERSTGAGTLGGAMAKRGLRERDDDRDTVDGSWENASVSASASGGGGDAMDLDMDL